MSRARRPTSTTSGSIEVPATFGAFCEWLGVQLTPGQAELVRVAYDGGIPGGDMGRAIFGPVEDVPMGARGVVAAVCGARAGKSYVLLALRMVWGMFVRDLRILAPGQRAVALVVAPNIKLRQEVVNYALGAIRSKPELSRCLAAPPSATEFLVRRPDGHEVIFEGGVATRGGYGARGRWFTDFALDESAFFLDDTYVVNDEAIFAAGSARVLPGGQTLVTSTPWAEKGLLFNLYKRNFGHPVDAIVAHAPTLLLNDNEQTRAVVERVRRADPDRAKCEFDAQFLSSGTSVFFEAGAVDAAVDSTLPDVVELLPGDEVAAGADFGFRSDSSALVLIIKRGDKLIVGDIVEMRPEDGMPLKPSATVEAFATRIKGKCGSVMADQHYRETVHEVLEQHRLVYVSAPNTPADAYMKARAVLREGKLVLPNNARLLQQMREVQGRPTSGGGMSIVHPRWRTGGHGDLVAALVLALYQVSTDKVQAKAPELGSAQWEEDAYERRRQRWEQSRTVQSRNPTGNIPRNSDWKR